MFSHVLNPRRNFYTSDKFRKYVNDSTYKFLQKKSEQHDSTTQMVNYAIITAAGSNDKPSHFQPHYLATFVSISALFYYFYYKK
jgi:hypothetical protein